MNLSGLILLTSIALAAIISAFVTWAIRPLLQQYALAKPNARSSHVVPTPQGAGTAVIAATLLVAGILLSTTPSTEPHTFLAAFAATTLMALIGAADDIKSIPVMPRLLLQGLCVGIVLYALPENYRIFSFGPLWLERVMLFLAGLWFVNLVNFMDGLDWITVAEVVPVTATLAFLGWFGNLSPATTLTAAALCGAIGGFAPFNRPVAKIFLGDVGSLPIGLLLGWCLLDLASHQFTAALLLPLYYLADATLTLLRRLIKGERVWAAHRSHFYQRATDNGFSVLRVVGNIFVLNVMLAVLAVASTLTASLAIKASILLIGTAAVAVVLLRFSRRQ